MLFLNMHVFFVYKIDIGKNVSFIVKTKCKRIERFFLLLEMICKHSLFACHVIFARLF